MKPGLAVFVLGTLLGVYGLTPVRGLPGRELSYFTGLALMAVAVAMLVRAGWRGNAGRPRG